MLDGRPQLCRRQPVPPATGPRELLTSLAGGQRQLHHAAGHPEHGLREFQRQSQGGRATVRLCGRRLGKDVWHGPQPALRDADAGANAEPDASAHAPHAVADASAHALADAEPDAAAHAADSAAPTPDTFANPEKFRRRQRQR